MWREKYKNIYNHLNMSQIRCKTHPFQYHTNRFKDKFRRTLLIVRAGVAKTKKIQQFALYQNETSQSNFVRLLIIRKL